MKLSENFTGKLATIAAAVVAISLVSASAQSNPGSAVVRQLDGTADYSDGSGVWKPLKVGKSLSQNTVIRTSAGSDVYLNLGNNGPWVQLTEGSTLGIDTLTYEKVGDSFKIDTRLNLKAGRVLGQVKKTSSASNYEVVTPVSVVGIRGTDYDISANGKTAIEDGQAVVVYIDPTTQVATTHLVPTGNTFDPNSGAVNPSNPGDLLPVKWPTTGAPVTDDFVMVDGLPILLPHPTLSIDGGHSYPDYTED